ncbi:MAG TPA: hypothetical protein VFZ66_20100 [Herpetosiphonaceae bacterium]
MIRKVMSQHRNSWRVTAALFALTGIVESFAFGHLNAFTPPYLEQLGALLSPLGMLAIFSLAAALSVVGFGATLLLDVERQAASSGA